MPIERFGVFDILIVLGGACLALLIFGGLVWLAVVVWRRTQ
jgi:hypothetical protein